MGETTGIEWCDHTFNAWTGCQKVSPGCKNCYAESWAERFGRDFGARIVASEAKWKEPLRWNRKAQAAGVRKRVFCNSLADVFEDRPELRAPRLRLFRLIFATPSLDWLLLTKRPENVRGMIEQAAFDCTYPDADNQALNAWCHNPARGRPHPPANVWLGVSVEDQQRANERIPLLLDTPAAVRFLSCEPLLGSVDLTSVVYERAYGTGLLNATTGDKRGHVPNSPLGSGPRVDWVIVGGESGANARPCNVEWVRSIVEQCRDASVACFVKQLGSKPMDWFDAHHGGLELVERPMRDRKGGDPAEWPEEIRVREFPSTVGIGG